MEAIAYYQLRPSAGEMKDIVVEDEASRRVQRKWVAKRGKLGEFHFDGGVTSTVQACRVGGGAAASLLQPGRLHASHERDLGLWVCRMDLGA